MEFKIPYPLKVEHEELHNMLSKATKEPGEIGDAAKAVAKLMHPHFIKEEEYALPPLELLRDLARGKVTPAMKEALDMTDKLIIFPRFSGHLDKPQVNRRGGGVHETKQKEV